MGVQAEDEQKFELRPHLFKAYLKSIGFKLLHVIDDKDSGDITELN